MHVLCFHLVAYACFRIKKGRGKWTRHMRCSHGGWAPVPGPHHHAPHKYIYGHGARPAVTLNSIEFGKGRAKKKSTSSYSNSSPVVPLPLYLFVCLPPAPQLIKRSHFDYCYNKGGRSRRLAGRPSFFEREGFGQRLLLPKIRIHSPPVSSSLPSICSRRIFGISK